MLSVRKWMFSFGDRLIIISMLIGFLLPLLFDKIRPSAPTANGTGIMAALALGAVGFLLFIPITGPLYVIGSLTKKLSGLSSDAAKTDKPNS